MKPTILSILAAAAFLATAACDLDAFETSQRFKEEFHFRHDLKPGGRLAVENFNGSVEIEGWNQSYVEIDGEKYASTRENLDRMSVQVKPSADFIDVRTVRETGISRWGNMGARYRIRVPSKTRLDGIVSSNGPITIRNVEEVGRVRTSNGPVRLQGTAGNADIDTSNGPVEIRDFSGPANVHTSNGPVTVSGATGRLDVVTSNGPVRAEMSAASDAVRLRTSNGPLTLTFSDAKVPDVTASTSNGPVTVRMPANAKARIKAHTSNSSIDCSLPGLNVESKSKTSLAATLGGGGPLLDLATSNGRVRIEER
ncbi:MAG: DUF4097 family beta strand repeat-containing protein [Bryobacteraceae bacterium]